MWSGSEFKIFAYFTERAVWEKDVLQNKTLLFPLEAPLVDLLQLCSLDVFAQKLRSKLILTFESELYIMKISFQSLSFCIYRECGNDCTLCLIPCFSLMLVRT